MRTRVEIVTEQLERGLAEAPGPPDARTRRGGVQPRSHLQADDALRLLDDMFTSRALDIAARRLKASGDSYYTISSAGHEANAVIGALTRNDDPAFLHYRSGALFAARARKTPGVDVIRDTVLSFTAAAADPIAQGRHKVWGSRSMWVPPQTSTIASHLPKAVGTAFAIERARRMGRELAVPDDAIVVCSFGDASLNHATALAGLNAARYSHRRGAGAPVVFVCEDNGIGISTPTPSRWVERTVGSLPYLGYVQASGHIDDIYDATLTAIERCRETRAPVLLHLQTVRLWGHAGSDVESGYRTRAEIEASEAADPLLAAGRRLVALGVAEGHQLLQRWQTILARVDAMADDLAGGPSLATRSAVMAPLSPVDTDAALTEAASSVLDDNHRRELHGADLPERATAPARRTMGAHINATLHDEMAARPQALVFGEDVARKGGVYHVTAGLLDRFGSDRVFDTLLDETTILGVAQGAGMMGFLPIPEIQYLAYLHNALDQLRGEAASLQFFSSSQFSNPMVVRLAGLAYQKGFGGHFHNDNSIGALRDIPGLLIATPSRGDDAARLLRGALAIAASQGRVVVFLEPIALYHEKDLHSDGDEGWLFDYPAPVAQPPLLPGDVGRYDPPDGGVGGDGQPDVLLVTYANGVRMSLQAAAALADDGIRAEVLDVRWLNPLPHQAIAERARACGRVLVVDECRETAGGIADAVLADLMQRRLTVPAASVRAADSFVPLGPAADTVLVSTEQIIASARDLVSG